MKHIAALTPVLVFMASSCVRNATLGELEGKVSSNNQLVLRANTVTYFKEKSDAMAWDKSYDAGKCQIARGATLFLKQMASPDGSTSYYYGKLLKPVQNSADDQQEFCSGNTPGYLFKTHFDVVQVSEPVATATPNPSDMNPDPVETPVAYATPSKISTPETGAVQQGVVNFGTAAGYVAVRTQAVLSYSHELNTPAGQGTSEPDHAIMAVPSADTSSVISYMKDGRSRVFGGPRPLLWPVYLSGGAGRIPDFTPVTFHDWDGTISKRVLVPRRVYDGFVPDSIRGNGCQDLGSDGKPGPQNMPGRGTAICNVPSDENGIYWMWLDCRYYHFVVTSSATGKSKIMRCAGGEATVEFNPL